MLLKAIGKHPDNYPILLLAKALIKIAQAAIEEKS